MSVGIGKLAKSRYEHEIKLDVTQALSQGRLLYLFGLIIHSHIYSKKEYSGS